MIFVNSAPLLKNKEYHFRLHFRIAIIRYYLV